MGREFAEDVFHVFGCREAEDGVVVPHGEAEDCEAQVVIVSLRRNAETTLSNDLDLSLEFACQHVGRDVVGELDVDGLAAFCHGENLANGPVGTNPPVVDNYDVVARGLDLLHDVCREDDSAVRGEISYQLPDLDNLVGVETCCRLVEDYDFRVADEGLGNSDALSVAFGEGADFLVSLWRETRHPDKVVDALRLIGNAVHSGHHREVFLYEHIEVEGIVLGEVANEATDGNKVAVDVHSANAYSPAVRTDVARRDFHERRLTGPVRTEEADNLSFGYLCRNAVEGSLLAVSLYYVVYQY